MTHGEHRDVKQRDLAMTNQGFNKETSGFDQETWALNHETWGIYGDFIMKNLNLFMKQIGFKNDQYMDFTMKHGDFNQETW